MADFVKCNTCGATYTTATPDGYVYYHACAPLTGRELRDAIAAKTITLTPQQRAQLDAADAADTAHPVATGEPKRIDLAIDALVVERPNKRDENAARGRALDGAPAMKAEGKGVTTLAKG